MNTARVRYQTLKVGEIDLHVRSLKDRNQFADEQGRAEQLGISEAQWPLFGVPWPAGLVLMHAMHEHEIAGRRVLEVGCGLGLASLLLNHLHEDITATDYHPEVEPFLRFNVELNGDEAIPFVRADWREEGHDLGPFELILGSDVLYERDHVALLSGFIERVAAPHCEVIIVDPGRPHRNHFTRAMQALGFAHSASTPKDTSSYLEEPFKGLIHTFVR